jgi:hypothetical protein
MEDLKWSGVRSADELRGSGRTGADARSCVNEEREKKAKGAETEEKTRDELNSQQRSERHASIVELFVEGIGNDRIQI